MTELISADTLQQLGVAPADADHAAPHLRRACKRFDILTAPRIAAFITQTAWRSSMYTVFEDDLCYPSAQTVRKAFPRAFPTLAQAGRVVLNPRALANAVYGGRLGNGDSEATDDGWTYRPRGCFPIVGRAEYMAVGEALGMPYKDKPHLVSEPEHAIITAAWYWATAGLSLLIDRGQFDATTARIGLAPDADQVKHSHLWHRALEVFSGR